MIKVYSNTKVFVHCPAGAVTGGAELLHQLVDVLRRNSIDAYIVYYGEKEHVVPSEYHCYDINVSETVEDKEENIEVIYEGVFNFIRNNKKIQKFLWWLSVDNFYYCSAYYLSLCNLFAWDKKMWAYEVLRRGYDLLFRGGKRSYFNTLSLKDLRESGAMNGYQSEYAQNFLQNNGFGEMVSLKDFINTDHIVPFSTQGREDIVLYNPKKGMEFTKKLIDKAPDLKWVAVQNMTRAQLVELMRKAKVYVDFGYHPGKDRLPRECAMNGCCIITGKRGSAAFFEDVAIPDKYKFDEKKASLSSIIDRVRNTLADYETAIGDFDFYRAAISREKQEFEEDAENLFVKRNSVK